MNNKFITTIPSVAVALCGLDTLRSQTTSESATALSVGEAIRFDQPYDISSNRSHAHLSMPPATDTEKSDHVVCAYHVPRWLKWDAKAKKQFDILAEKEALETISNEELVELEDLNNLKTQASISAEELLYHHAINKTDRALIELLNKHIQIIDGYASNAKT